MNQSLFSQVHAAATADNQFDLDERAAILEFDAGFDRITAETMALSEFLSKATANGNHFRILFAVASTE